MGIILVFVDLQQIKNQSLTLCFRRCLQILQWREPALQCHWFGTSLSVQRQMCCWCLRLERSSKCSFCRHHVMVLVSWTYQIELFDVQDKKLTPNPPEQQSRETKERGEKRAWHISQGYSEFEMFIEEGGLRPYKSTTNHFFSVRSS
jgi:hypothetical protein